MKTTIEPTGERMIEDSYQSSLGAYIIYTIHAASYQFAEQYCIGKRVLDLGCGSGYGTAKLSNIASTIYGVDVSSEAVNYAKHKYNKSNLQFSTIEPDTNLPFQNDEFDVIISFQVIEHVYDHHQYLSESQRVLKKGGSIILITPDRKNRLLPYQKPWNRWHLREYSRESLASLVENHFEIVKTLEMGARKDVADIELNRYRRTKWATILFTLPFTPNAIRVMLLNLLHMLISLKKRSKRNVKKSFDFGIEVVNFKKRNSKSLNLVIVAKKV